jgi:general secretion pathway protein G
MLQRNSCQGARRNHSSGLTLLELVLAIGILLVLSTAAIPLARMTVQRQKEVELHRDLREIRDAIDRYKNDADKNLIRTEVGSQNYPPDLQTLVDGVTISAGPGATGGISASALAGASGTSQFGSVGTPQLGGPGAAGGFALPGSAASQSQPSQTAVSALDLPSKVRYLRKIPVDPITGKADWGLRAVQDDPDSHSWGGHNVFDVYSQSDATAIDGTKYSDW